MTIGLVPRVCRRAFAIAAVSLLASIVAACGPDDPKPPAEAVTAQKPLDSTAIAVPQATGQTFPVVDAADIPAASVTFDGNSPGTLSNDRTTVTIQGGSRIVIANEGDAAFGTLSNWELGWRGEYRTANNRYTQSILPTNFFTLAGNCCLPSTGADPWVPYRFVSYGFSRKRTSERVVAYSFGFETPVQGVPPSGKTYAVVLRTMPTIDGLTVVDGEGSMGLAPGAKVTLNLDLGAAPNNSQNLSFSARFTATLDLDPATNRFAGQVNSGTSTIRLSGALYGPDANESGFAFCISDVAQLANPVCGAAIGR